MPNVSCAAEVYSARYQIRKGLIARRNCAGENGVQPSQRAHFVSFSEIWTPDDCETAEAAFQDAY